MSDLHTHDYFAYLETRIGPETDPYQGTIWVRVQVRARRGATGMVITGMWVVYLSGPRQVLTPAFDAIDGNGDDKNGYWNFGGRPNPDAAVAGDNANPSRYPGISPAYPTGLKWGRRGYVLLEFTYQTWNGNHRDGLNSINKVNRILFTP